MKVYNILGLVLIFTYVRDVKSVTDEWFGQKWLDENYLFKWKTNHLEKVIIIRVEVMTKGWVSFGLSKHGKFSEVDMAIGWVNDMGQSSLKDFWINEFSVRSLDMSQDWELLSGEENATHTMLEFNRRYVTCDETNDLQIYENDFEMSIIVFDYSFLDPVNIENIPESIIERIYHLNFFENQAQFEPKENDIEVVDHWLNVSLSHKQETIQCVLFKQVFKEKRQIVKFQVITNPTFDKIQLDHHFTWIDCGQLIDVDKHVGTLMPCYDKNNKLNDIRKNCSTNILGSILNDSPVLFPNFVGISIDPKESPYFLIEGHLINSWNKSIEASLSFRFWLTKQIRKYEAGMTTFVATVGYFKNTWGFIVPPKQEHFKISSVLSTYCYRDDHNWDDNGIYIFQLVLHTHFGKRIELRQYRDDILTRKIELNHFDDHFQPFRLLENPINLRKTDKIMGFCDYNSMNQTKTYTSPKEHCSFIVFYYPAKTLKDDRIYSSRIPYESMLKISGLEQIDGYDTEIYDNIIIRKPVKYNNTKLIDFISENKYKMNDPKELEEFQMSADMMECCYYADKSHAENRPCIPITKPPGLYQSIMRRRKENSCPLKQHLIENKQKYNKNYIKNKIDIRIGGLFKSFFN